MGKSKDMEPINKAWETEGGRSNKHGGNIIQGREVKPKKNRRNRKSNECFPY